ncbi:protein EDS1B-like [Camellia sinensis]|uniref:protein EDS1B-like n=1 Tax=Camellia sinensis TaxID=4442 RepID=UPI0010369F3E|nr:protein EDS1B-like [Camellia sinensis]
MKNVQSVTSHAACNMMGSTNPLLQTITSFVQLSPYRPFGTYILCSGNGKLVVVENSDAVLQLLFYSCQLKSGQEIEEVGYESLKEHSGYENELEGSLEMQNVVYLDNYLKEVPLSSDASVVGEAATVNAALNDLGLQMKRNDNLDKVVTLLTTVHSEKTNLQYY